MKESKLIEMSKKIDALTRIVQRLINELNNVKDLSVGTLETIKKMPKFCGLAPSKFPSQPRNLWGGGRGDETCPAEGGEGDATGVSPMNPPNCLCELHPGKFSMAQKRSDRVGVGSG